jgi:hypothetical protein
MKEKYGGHSIGITSAKNTSLSFRNSYYSEQKEQVDAQQQNAPDKPKSFSNGVKNKISSLFGHKAIPRLCAFQ